MNATINMLDECEAAAGVLVGMHLCTTDAEMEKNIGRDVKFIWREGMGSIAERATFRIIGVQLIYDGSKAYRVLCNAYEDRFGRPARPSDIEFV